jgi:phospholipid/cholesterol/gamma-HCH transport system substrate-binding protein
MNSANYWKLGAFVLGGLVLAVITLIWLGAADLSRATRRLVTYFDESVTGLDVGSSVKYRGVSVGTVSEISIASDLRHVRVTSLVYEDVLSRLGLSEGQSLQQSKPGAGDSTLRIQLTSTGITGVKFLLIDFYDSRRFPVEKLPFDPGPDYLPSTPSTLKSIEEAAVDVGMQLPELTMRASQTLQRLADSVEEIQHGLDPLLTRNGSIARLLDQYERTGAQLERTAAVVESEFKAAKFSNTTSMVRDAAGAVSGLAVDATQTSEEARDGLASLQETLDSIRALTDYLERDPSALVRGRAQGPAGKGVRP